MTTKREMYEALRAYAQRQADACRTDLDPDAYVRWIQHRNAMQERLLTLEVNAGPLLTERP